MIVISKREYPRNLEELALPYPDLGPQPEPYILRKETKYIIIHDTAIKPRGSGKYLTYEGLLQAYKTLDPAFVGLHYIIDVKSQENIRIYSARPLMAIGNHAGDYYDMVSIGIAFIGNFDKVIYGKYNSILLNSFIVSTIYNLAAAFQIPVENIIAFSDAVAMLKEGIEDSPDKEDLISVFWDRSPGYYIFKDLKKLREVLMGLGIPIRDMYKFKFVNEYNSALIINKGLFSASKRAKQRADKRDYVDKDIKKWLREGRKKRPKKIRK